MDGGSLTNPSNHDIRASRVHSCEVNRGSVSCIASWPLNSSALLRWLALFAALRCFPLHQLGWIIFLTEIGPGDVMTAIVSCARRHHR